MLALTRCLQASLRERQLVQRREVEARHEGELLLSSCFDSSLVKLLSEKGGLLK